MKWFHFFLLSLTLILTGCGHDDGVKQAKFYAFGTEIDISLSGVDTEQANGTIKLLEQRFDAVDKTWHAWRPSVLTDINHAIAANQPIAVTDEVAELIRQAQSLANSSQHLFNPAAGQLFELWGFHQDDWFSSRPPPSEKTITDWLIHSPTLADITIKDGILTSQNTRVKLGFGGFAKGFAIDQAISVLQTQGIDNALVNIGGDLRAIGQVDDRAWHIGIRHPRQDGMIAMLAIQGDESVFTSGDYERFFEHQGQRYCHIIDPREGYPATEAISVTVLHHSATVADAAATALFVAGLDWPSIATSMGISHVMLIRSDGDIEMSPDMHQRIKLLNHEGKVTVQALN